MKVINPETDTDDQPQVDEEALRKEREVAETLKYSLRSTLQTSRRYIVENDVTSLLRDVLEQIGRFYRMQDGTPLFLRHSDGKLCEINRKADSDFGRLVTYLGDVSVRHPIISRSLDCIRARVVEEADTISEEERVK